MLLQAVCREREGFEVVVVVVRVDLGSAFGLHGSGWYNTSALKSVYSHQISLELVRTEKCKSRCVKCVSVCERERTPFLTVG